ncbi:hypothetical protein ACO1O0_005791 [Amphichorda felina]
MARRGPTHSGPYGLACTNCFKSKSKCVARLDADGRACQRCHRLDKECRPSDSIRRRTTGKKNSTARIAELESKLESSRDNSIDIDIDIDIDAEGGGERERDLPDPETDADGLLSTFRSRMLPNFAFIHLSTEVTAQELQNNQPFLFRAIICVTSPSTRDKLTRGRELKTSLCEAMLGLGDHQHESNLDKMDLLLGLLTYLSWGWDHVLHRCSMPQLMMQAMSLAREMPLYQSMPEGARIMEPVAPLFEKDCYENSTDSTAGTARDFLDRQRAVLGCFVLSSAVSAYFGHTDALRWTMQMEQGLAAISMNRDCPTDSDFAFQIRLQLLADKAVRVYRQQEMDPGQAVTETATLPALASLTTLQGQLKELRKSLSWSPHPQLTPRGLLAAHAHSTELSLNEATHAVTSTVPVMLCQFGRMTSSNSGDEPVDGATNQPGTAWLERSMCLWQCVRSSMACASALAEPPPSELEGITFMQWAQLAHSVAALDFLSNTMDDPLWDRQAVRAHFDMAELLDRIVDKLQLVAEQGDDAATGNVFGVLAQRMERFRSNGTGSGARERRARGEADAEWERGKANGGGRGLSPAAAMRLFSIAEDGPWLGRHWAC